jgi:predicted signal transduction protein with EAL and GGDEF domain
VLVERGNERDLLAWAQNARAKISENRVQFNERTMQCTCSIGAAIFEEKSDGLGSLASRAAKACRLAREAGGNRVQIDEPPNKADDARAVANITNALMKDGFRLVFQPIANLLRAERSHMFDIARAHGRRQQPRGAPQPVPAGRGRNGTMRKIDRWVLGSAT